MHAPEQRRLAAGAVLLHLPGDLSCSFVLCGHGPNWYEISRNSPSGIFGQNPISAVYHHVVKVQPQDLHACLKVLLLLPTKWSYG